MGIDWTRASQAYAPHLAYALEGVVEKVLLIEEAISKNTSKSFYPSTFQLREICFFRDFQQGRVPN